MAGKRRTGVAWVLGVAAASCLQFAVALEGSLRRLHDPMEAGVGYSHLADPDKVRTVWDIWERGVLALASFKPAGPIGIVRWHAVLHALFVLGAVGAVVALFRLPPDAGWWSRLTTAVKRPWAAILLGAAALALTRDVIDLTMTWGGQPRFWMASTLAVLRPAAYAALVTGLLTFLVTRWGAVWRLIKDLWYAPAVLRIFLLLEILFVVILFYDLIGSQTEDVAERWFEGQRLDGIATLVAYVAFVAVVASGRHLEPNQKQTSTPNLAWLGVGLSVAGGIVLLVSWLGHGSGLLILGVMVTIVGLGELIPERPEPVEKDRQAPFLRAALAAIPAMAIGLLFVRTGANHAVLRGGTAMWKFVSAGALAQVLAVLAWHFSHRTKEDWSARHFGIQAAIVLGLMGAMLTVWAGSVGSFAVLLASLAGLAAFGLLVRSVFRSQLPPQVFRLRWGWLRFRRAPMVSLVLIWVLAASVANGGLAGGGIGHRITYYDVRIAPMAAPFDLQLDTAACREATAKQVGTPATLREEFCRWVVARRAEQPGAATLPLVLVTASGGGVRAALWTEKVLDCLFLRDDPATCDTSRASNAERWPLLFAANGASGGSVGIVSTVAERLSSAGSIPAGVGDDRWFRNHQERDTLAPLLGAAILRDSLLGLLGVFVGEDRSTTLEDAWSRRWHTTLPKYCLAGAPGASSPPIVELGFRSLRDSCPKPLPLMLFNATDSATGRRVNLAPLDLDDTPPAPVRSKAPYDLVDYLAADQDVPLFSAAFLSARFPVVTSSGRLPTCRVAEERFKTDCPDAVPQGPQLNAIHLVDGGYSQNSGSAQVAEVWAHLGPLVAKYNEAVRMSGSALPSVRPVFVEIENGEVKRAEPDPITTTTLPAEKVGEAAEDEPLSEENGRFDLFGEILRPLTAVINVRSRGKEEPLPELRSSFTPCAKAAATAPTAEGEAPVWVHFAMYEHPGRRLPLGWTLSQTSLDAIDAQYAVGVNEEAAACFARVVPRPPPP